MVASSDSNEKKHSISLIRHFIAGGAGGMCLVFAGHPFDTIKVRLQTLSSTKQVQGQNQRAVFTGFIDCVSKTYRGEGIRGFYKGMLTPTVMVTPLFAVSFFGFGLGSKLMGRGQSTPLGPGQLFCAGAISGVVATFLITPVERIKCLLQVQHGQSGSVILYKGPVDCARQLLQKGGIPLLYQGFGATLARAIPQCGLYFGSYELLKVALAPPEGGKMSLWRTLTAGGLTGIINWAFVLPLDVIKSRVQTAPEGKYPRGLRDAYKDLMRTEGPRGLFKGVVPVFIRAFPANAACFVGFESAMAVMNWVHPENH